MSYNLDHISLLWLWRWSFHLRCQLNNKRRCVLSIGQSSKKKRLWISSKLHTYHTVHLTRINHTILVQSSVNVSQEKKLCSLVLKLKVFFQVFIGALHTVYHESSTLFFKCTRYFFRRDTSSESNCNRNYRGRPSGWNQWLLQLSTSTRVLTYKPTKYIQIAIPQYPLLYIPLF